ncbi:unnamed protein product [Rhizophagus irregularis]|uniref:Uncharacterized protein n=1 Tax=Rhizophagus irregularis TaxID=588596 RepID=A0A2I1HMF1_9GLOM|nr:hypothetical protein RhiirA4_483326 [Rhizophagus irregularis]CAB4440304.1 unnamed protein product [Rhizophagus irregularis]
MYHSQDNIDNINNNVHESNITRFINYNYNRLSLPTSATIVQTENINCENPSCNCNFDTSVMNNNNFPVANATISLDHNQLISQNTSNNNDIISSDNNYQQPIFNDVSNNNINISPNNKCQQFMSNNISPPPQFHPQYIDQKSPQTNVFPSPNSLGIVINPPQTYVIIMPSCQQDTFSNYFYH